jgi:hypothetical protein
MSAKCHFFRAGSNVVAADHAEFGQQLVSFDPSEFLAFSF